MWNSEPLHCPWVKWLIITFDWKFWVKRVYWKKNCGDCYLYSTFPHDTYCSKHSRLREEDFHSFHAHGGELCLWPPLPWQGEEKLSSWCKIDLVIKMEISSFLWWLQRTRGVPRTWGQHEGFCCIVWVYQNLVYVIRNIAHAQAWAVCCWHSSRYNVFVKKKKRYFSCTKHKNEQQKKNEWEQGLSNIFSMTAHYSHWNTKLCPTDVLHTAKFMNYKF